MERLTDCAQGYCEMYCKKYGRCFEDPENCVFKDEIKLYDALKSIEGIVPFDRLLELADADRAGKLVVLPCKVGDVVFVVDCEYLDCNNCDMLENGKDCPYIDNPICPKGTVRQRIFHYSLIPYFGKTVFLTREEAEAALKGDNVHA